MNFNIGFGVTNVFEKSNSYVGMNALQMNGGNGGAVVLRVMSVSYIVLWCANCRWRRI